jgi:hypothetical protein
MVFSGNQLFPAPIFAFFVFFCGNSLSASTESADSPPPKRLPLPHVSNTIRAAA